jgi:hypothetical protein
MEWLSYRANVSGELYYNTGICWTQACTGSATPDPWVSIYYSGGNGDGALVYPGRQTGSPVGTTTVGVTTPIWLPSMRLKYIRDGEQDYEYLYVLNQNGQGPYATAQLTSFITNSSTFDNGWSGGVSSGTPLTTARANLGTKMHQLTYGPVLLPPPALTGTVQ